MLSRHVVKVVFDLEFCGKHSMHLDDDGFLLGFQVRQK